MSLRAALRTAIADFYFNSWRLAPANLAWGAVLLLALLVGPFSLPGMVLLIVLAVPTVGLYRMAALLARGQPAMLSDFSDGMRRLGPTALAVGTAAALIGFVFATNLRLGFVLDNAAGWFVSGMALWGMVGLGMFLVAFWPVLADPNREAIGLRRRLTLAGLVVIGRPARLLMLTALVVVVVAVSTVIFAAILLVSVAYVALASARYVLPMLDSLEERIPEGRLQG